MYFTCGHEMFACSRTTDEGISLAGNETTWYLNTKSENRFPLHWDNDMEHETNDKQHYLWSWGVYPQAMHVE